MCASVGSAVLVFEVAKALAGGDRNLKRGGREVLRTDWQMSRSAIAATEYGLGARNNPMLSNKICICERYAVVVLIENKNNDKSSTRNVQG